MNLKFAVTVAAFLCLFAACQRQSVEQTAMSDEKLAQVMADLSVADAATTGLVGYQKDSLMHVYFKQVYEIHGITLEAYEKDMRIVAQDVSRLEKIVKEAEEWLNEGKKKAEKPAGN